MSVVPSGDGWTPDGRRVDWTGARSEAVTWRAGEARYDATPAGQPGAGAGVRVGAGAPATVRVSDTRVSGSLGPGM